MLNFSLYFNVKVSLNSLIVQFGRANKTSAQYQVQLPRAFTTTTYAVVSSPNDYTSSVAAVWCHINKTVTTFVMNSANYQVAYYVGWIAIGY